MTLDEARALKPSKPRSCFNADGFPKRRYQTRNEAKSHAEKWQTVYPCAEHGWHVATERR